MKATTLNARIEKNLTTKTGSVKSIFTEVIYLLQNPERTLRPVSWSRSGGHMNLRDNSQNIIWGLKLIGIDFEIGNDAPRGGKEGYFVRLTKKGKTQVKDFNEARRLEAERILAAEVQAQIERFEKAKELISSLPANEVFEAKWQSTELKIESGLSWSEYREMLKATYPDEWQVLKAKFRAQQSIKG